MVSGVVGMADVPSLDRLLKKSVSSVFSRSDRSTYRLVCLAIQSPCALLTTFLSSRLLLMLKRRTADGGLRLAGLKRAGRGWTFANDLDDDEKEHDIEDHTEPQDIGLNPASVSDLFL